MQEKQEKQEKNRMVWEKIKAKVSKTKINKTNKTRINRINKRIINSKRITYENAYDIKDRVLEIIKELKLTHIKPEFVACIRSKNAKTNAIARCHALPKPFHIAFSLSPRYIIEVVSEKFDKLNEDEKTKILIHELLHIPKSFGGGFRHHEYVNDKNVEKLFEDYRKNKRYDT